MRYKLLGRSGLRLSELSLGAMGRVVARPVEGLHAAGRHVLRWDAASRAGGLYYIRVQAGETAVTRRVAVLR